MKLDLNLNVKKYEDPMSVLVDKYLEITRLRDEHCDLTEKNKKSILDKYGRKIKGVEDRIVELAIESCEVAAYLPPIYEDKDYLILNGCTSQMPNGEFLYRMEPSIYYNKGNGIVSRAADLFTATLGLEYDSEKNWKENVQVAIDKSIEDMKFAKDYCGIDSGMYKAMKMRNEVNNRIRDIAPEIIKERLVTTEKIIELANKGLVAKIKQNSYSITPPESSIRDKILAEKKTEIPKPLPRSSPFERER